MATRIPPGPRLLTPAEKAAKAIEERVANEAARDAALAREARLSELHATLAARRAALGATCTDPEDLMGSMDASILAEVVALKAEIESA